MDWQDYVDNQLVATGYIQKAAVAGLDGSLLAKSSGFDVADEEMAKVVAGFENQEKLHSGGFTLAGQHYNVSRFTDHLIEAKSDAGGVICVKTPQCIIVAVCGEALQQVVFLLGTFGAYLDSFGC